DRRETVRSDELLEARERAHLGRRGERGPDYRRVQDRHLRDGIRCAQRWSIVSTSPAVDIEGGRLYAHLGEADRSDERTRGQEGDERRSIEWMGRSAGRRGP